MSEIRVEEDQARGRYVMDTPDGQEAYLTFVRERPDHMSITYSFVPPAFRGRGVAVGLIERAVAGEYAGMVIAPDQSLALVTPVRRALARGLPIVMIGSPLLIPAGEANLTHTTPR